LHTAAVLENWKWFAPAPVYEKRKPPKLVLYEHCGDKWEPAASLGDNEGQWVKFCRDGNVIIRHEGRLVLLDQKGAPRLRSQPVCAAEARTVMSSPTTASDCPRCWGKTRNGCAVMSVSFLLLF
jgi:hypothetical protein